MSVAVGSCWFVFNWKAAFDVRFGEMSGGRLLVLSFILVTTEYISLCFLIIHPNLVNAIMNAASFFKSALAHYFQS